MSIKLQIDLRAEKRISKVVFMQSKIGVHSFSHLKNEVILKRFVSLLLRITIFTPSSVSQFLLLVNLIRIRNYCNTIFHELLVKVTIITIRNIPLQIVFLQRLFLKKLKKIMRKSNIIL